MAVLHFWKYQGTGNDFIMVDNMSGAYVFDPELVNVLCDRKFGIGSDGLISLEHKDGLDFYMNFFNPDGSQSFCGNGSRCAVAFASKLGLLNDSEVRFEAIDGLHKALFDVNWIKVKMQDVHIIDVFNEDDILNTGSPHYIRYVAELENVDVKNEGARIRYSKAFQPGGINVNFVKETPQGIAMRTYERGVEDETLSCGTGVTAAALSYARRRQLNGCVKVQTRGGELQVEFVRGTDNAFSDIWLCGPAMSVFEGSVPIEDKFIK